MSNRSMRACARALGAIGMLAAALAAHGQTYPAKPVRIVVPFPAGGNADILARLAAQRLGDSLGQTFLIDNRAGASGIIGTEAVARAAPDGHTLLMGTTGTHTTNPAVFAKLPYDPVKDFAPISNFADAPFLLVVHPSVPARSAKELVALARARPGQLHYASFGNGSSAHLAGEMLRTQAGIDIVHVAYKGGPPALTDLVGGHVALMFNAVPIVLPQARAGRLRVLGIAAAKRVASLPEVPALTEAGLGELVAGSWYGLLAPAGTPREIVARLHGEIVKALAHPDVRARLVSEGAEPIGNAPEAFAEQIQRDIARWTRVARAARVPPL